MKPLVKVLLSSGALSWTGLNAFGHHLYDLLGLISTLCWVVIGSHGVYQLIVGEKRVDD